MLCICVETINPAFSTKSSHWPDSHVYTHGLETGVRRKQLKLKKKNKNQGVQNEAAAEVQSRGSDEATGEAGRDWTGWCVSVLLVCSTDGKKAGFMQADLHEISSK